jgi:hypothetical protein
MGSDGGKALLHKEAKIELAVVGYQFLLGQSLPQETWIDGEAIDYKDAARRGQLEQPEFARLRMKSDRFTIEGDLLGFVEGLQDGLQVDAVGHELMGDVPFLAFLAFLAGADTFPSSRTVTIPSRLLTGEYPSGLFQ